MLNYILRRLLWMVPTILIILMVNFAMMRLRTPSLVEEMTQGGRGEGGMQADKGTAANITKHLCKFRLAGYDLPSIINLRGFEDRQDFIVTLQQIEGSAQALKESERRELQTKLWLKGHFALEPLAEILRDDSLIHLHAPAAEAFVYCALRPMTPEDLQKPESWKKDVSALNLSLPENLIRYHNDPIKGFVLDDSSEIAQQRRQNLLAIWTQHSTNWQRTTWKKLKAVFLETGFTEIMRQLCTGKLYSETRQEFAFTLIADRWQVTVWINALALMLAWTISIPLGIHSARRTGTLEDQTTTSSLFFLWALPPFFVGTLFRHHFCTAYQGPNGTVISSWFPHAGLSSSGSEWLSTPAWLLDIAWHGILPLIVLTYFSFTALSRYMRGQLLDQLRADYVRTARAKGCSEDRIVYRHALPNSLITMITLGSHLLADLFGGALVVELLWSVPGLGRLMLDAAILRDAPLLMATTLISVVLLLVGILIADILYAVVDPRIRGRYA